jgi:hypothetical protein
MSGKKTVTARKHPALRQPTPLPSVADFWNPKTLEELVAEQGVRPIQRLEDVLGQGAGLWRDDAELDAFLAELRQRRQTGG